MDPIGPGNHERAWNDPPKFAFNSSGPGGGGNSSGRRRLLNKRVPVPIGPQAGSCPIPPPLKPGDGPPLGSTPPSGTGGIGPPPMCKPPTDMQLSEKTALSPKPKVLSPTENRTSQDILEEVETAFRNSLKRISEHIKANVHEDISKRFEVMKTMWMDDKLNDVVQNRMLTLTKAVDEGNFGEAWSIHQGLIVDYTSMCSPWMLGIKTLIAESRNLKKKTTGEKDTDEMKEIEDSQSRVPIVSPLDIGKVHISDKTEETSKESDEVK